MQIGLPNYQFMDGLVIIRPYSFRYVDNMSNFKDQLINDIEPVLRHAIAMVITILCIWIFQLVLMHTLGEEATLFGRIPIVYVAHTGDSLAFLRFFWKMVREFR